jgi:hypothetical protein
VGAIEGILSLVACVLDCFVDLGPDKFIPGEEDGMYTPRIARGVQPGRLRRTPFMNPLSLGGVSIEVSIPSSVIFFLDKNSDPRLVGGGASPV